MDGTTYSLLEQEDLALAFDDIGFDEEADAAGLTGAEPVTRAMPTKAVPAGPGFTADLKCVHRVFGTLYVTPYTSKAGNYYPGRYYVREKDKPVIKVIPHHMANGAANITVETLNQVALNRTGSWHFTIMSDGEIVQWLPLKVAAWTTSKRDADINAVTCEVENIKGADGDWAISEAAQRSLVVLMAELAEYYDGLSEYRFDGTPEGSNVHRHEWYANTNCPGPFIKRITPDLVKKANDLVAMNRRPPEPDDKTFSGIYWYRNKPYFCKNGVVITKPGEQSLRDGSKTYWYYVESDGTAAVDKDVYIPYTYSGEKPLTGKWVHYDADGRMHKGWRSDVKGHMYLYDEITGKMIKGHYRGFITAGGSIIDVDLYFDEITGILKTVNPADYKKEA